jgi:hypothetical protein
LKICTGTTINKNFNPQKKRPMKTIEQKIYSFEELGQQAQQNAIDHARKNQCNDFIYEDAYNTVKRFNEVFNTNEGWNSWLDVRTNDIGDDVLQLTGLRLRTYILNNYGYAIYNRKFLGISKNEDCNLRPHRMKNFRKNYKGNTYCFYYSNIQETTDSTLTGICYDHSILDPIYDFIKKPTDINFKQLLNECFENLKADIEEEIDYRNSDEFIKIEIIENQYEFYENGEIY